MQSGEARERETQRRSTARYRELLESVSDWVWEVDEHNVYTYSGPRLRDILGYEPADVLGRTPFDLMPPDEARRVAKLFAPIAAKRAPIVRLENVNRHKAGHLVVLETSGTPFFDAQGNFRGYRGIDRDITARKRAEEELRASEELNRGVLDALPANIAVLDRQGKIIAVNEAWKLFAKGNGGDQHGTGPGTNYLDVARATSRESATAGEAFEGISAVLSGERESFSMEYPCHSPTEQHWFVMYVTPLRSGDGGAVVSHRNITDRKRAEQSREEYVSLISHDLRTPLTVARGQAQLLRDLIQKSGVDGYAPRSVEAIITSTRRMNAMIQDLVDSARMESGQLHVNRNVLDMSAFIGDLVERLAGVLDTTRIELIVPTERMYVLADADRLERILTNLLINALKYSASNTKVTLSLTRQEAEVVTAVADRGPGMAPAALEHLFERYFRAGAGRERREGLGLGLYITKGLVEAQGGRIWVDTKVGEGTTFYFSLPAHHRIGDPSLDSE